MEGASQWRSVPPKTGWELTFEELLQLPPDELLAALKESGTPRQEHLAAAEGRPDVSRDLARVVDIYATEVRPLEGRYYGWLRGLRDLACRGEWEKIPKEPQAFIRKLLRKLPRTAEQESAPAETPPRKGKARTRRAEAAVHPRLLSGASRLPKRFPRLCRSGTSGGYGST
jgi:hypothetical protein